MKVASVLFGCVSAAGSVQEEGEVCEDILQRNVVLITPFGSSGIPPPYIRLSMRLSDALGNHRKARFPPLLYTASLAITMLPISVPSDLASKLLILLISTKAGPWAARLQLGFLFRTGLTTIGLGSRLHRRNRRTD
jgi:hypothetical protein